MTTQLHQVLAVVNTRKTEAKKATTGVYHTLQKPDLCAGISRTYIPKDEEGEPLPPESRRVTFTVTDLLGDVERAMTPYLDITAQRDWANCEAKADVVVDGNVVLSQVPVSYLLFLEKELVDLATVLKAAPTLDVAEEWTADPNSGLYTSADYSTLRSKKVPRNHVLSEATERHPANVQVYYEDVPVGTWRTVKLSGALPATSHRTLLTRMNKLSEAVKIAREQANTLVVPKIDPSPGAAIFGYLYR